VLNWGCDDEINSDVRERNGGRSGVFDGRDWPITDVVGPGAWEWLDDVLGLDVDFRGRADEIGCLEKAFEGWHPRISN